MRATATRRGEASLEDQALGGGDGGRQAQSGGFSGSAGRTCRTTLRHIPCSGTSTANTEVLHLARHAAKSGQAAFDCVSQHGQLLLLLCISCAPCMAFMQSLIASPDGGAVVAASMLARTCIAAHAEATGASARDSAIKITRMARGRCRVRDSFNGDYFIGAVTTRSRRTLVYGSPEVLGKN